MRRFTSEIIVVCKELKKKSDETTDLLETFREFDDRDSSIED